MADAGHGVGLDFHLRLAGIAGEHLAEVVAAAFLGIAPGNVVISAGERRVVILIGDAALDEHEDVEIGDAFHLLRETAADDVRAIGKPAATRRRGSMFGIISCSFASIFSS